MGVEFAPGMTGSEIDEIAAASGAPVPAELSMFLMSGVPIAPKWARWVDGPETVLATSREWIKRAFAFDVEQSQYWHPSFGERPQDPREAVEIATDFVAGTPALLPIYAHRFLATAPVDGQRAVLSVWQAVDSIFYGNDLADYFANEFSVSRPSWSATALPRVPVWEDLFDLFGLDDSMML